MTYHNSHAPLRVVVDDRERCSRVAAALDRLEHVEVEIRRLGVGDYMVGRSLLAERKTLVDFAESVRDGRLFRQVLRLQNADCDRACLILEGGADSLGRIRLSRHAFQGALITVTLLFGLPVLRSRSAEETAFLVVTGARQLWRREAIAPRRCGRKVRDLRHTQLVMLQSVRDIGPRRAAALLAAFGTPSGVMAATADGLASVRGVGPSTAARLWRALHQAPDDAAEEPGPGRVRDGGQSLEAALC